MAKEEITPSEWQIMGSLVGMWGAADLLRGLQKDAGKCGYVDEDGAGADEPLKPKDVLGYTVDEHDSRVYHYYVQKPREECVEEKSRKFVDSYFSGNGTNAMAALLQSFTLTDEQIKELEEILEKRKDRSAKSPDKEGETHV